jgi:YD repeat-containing protein
MKISIAINNLLLLTVVAQALLLATAADAASYEYDTNNRIISVYYSNGYRVEYSYDAAGNRKSYAAITPGATKSESLAMTSGVSPSITITNAGGPGASYDWYRNGSKISTTSAPSLAVSGFSPQDAGGYRVIIREADGSVSIVELMVKLNSLNYESWLEFKEGAGASPTDPGLGRMARSQPDGVENILKYAMGKGPHESAGDSLPHIVWHGEGPQRRMGLKMSRIFAPGDIAIRIEASEGLDQWFDVTNALVPAVPPIVAANGLSEEVTAEVQGLVSPVTGGALKFFRLSVDPVSNKLYAAGANGSGRVGDGTTTNRSTPTLVNRTQIGTGRFTGIAAGGDFTIALLADGRLFSWGSNSVGRLGDGTTTSRTSPVPVVMTGVLGGKKVSAIATGASHSLVLDDSGQVYSWGRNLDGAIGDNSTSNRNAPVMVSTLGAPAGKTITSIKAGTDFSLALSSEGLVYSWGRGTDGRLGSGSTTRRLVPGEVVATGVMLNDFIVEIAAGQFHSLALGEGGRVYAWGRGSSGQLGNGGTAQSTVPVLVNLGVLDAGERIRTITAGGDSSFALTNLGRIIAWGANTSGELGDGTTQNRPEPVWVMQPAWFDGLGFESVTPGFNHCFARLTDGTFVAWGQNTSGQFGNGTQTGSTTPIAIDGAWTRISSGPTANHSFFISAD